MLLTHQITEAVELKYHFHPHIYTINKFAIWLRIVCIYSKGSKDFSAVIYWQMDLQLYTVEHILISNKHKKEQTGVNYKSP
jgi:hypothetical protein